MVDKTYSVYGRKIPLKQILEEMTEEQIGKGIIRWNKDSILCTEKRRFHSGVQIGKVLVLHFRVPFLVHFVPGIFVQVRSN
jgi:hypothetical protein